MCQNLIKLLKLSIMVRATSVHTFNTFNTFLRNMQKSCSLRLRNTEMTHRFVMLGR